MIELSSQHMDDLAEDLGQKYRELADVEAVERQGRFQAWIGVDSNSVSERDRWADIQVLNLSCDIIKLKGEIRALELEYNHIRFRRSLAANQHG